MTEFNTPKHYVLADGSDSMDALEKILGSEEFKGFLRGNAIKYLIRYKQKGGVEDLKKAKDYINRLIAIKEEKPSEKKKTDESGLRSVTEVADAIIKALGDKSEEEKTIAEKLFEACKKYRLHLNVDFDILFGTEVSITYDNDKLFSMSLYEENDWYFVDRILNKMPRPMAKEIFEVCKDYARAPIEEREDLLCLF